MSIPRLAPHQAAAAGTPPSENHKHCSARMIKPTNKNSAIKDPARA